MGKAEKEKRLNTKPSFWSPSSWPGYISEKYRKRTDDLIERDNAVKRECDACHADPLKKDEECNAICNKGSLIQYKKDSAAATKAQIAENAAKVTEKMNKLKERMN